LRTGVSSQKKLKLSKYAGGRVVLNKKSAQQLESEATKPPEFFKPGAHAGCLK